MSRTASFPVIGLGLDPSGISKGLRAAVNTLKVGMASIKSTLSTPFQITAVLNQASEFSAKITRLLGEPFRQLMAQEDLFSKFSVLAGGTKEAGAALERFKSIGRDTGLSMQEMSASLDTLLQGQFSFTGAVVQIKDLSKVASILGEGSLPALSAAAAKFRSSAFASFEDVNSVASMGLPIYDALAKQLGVTSEAAREMAQEGRITGLQARNALNAAGEVGAARNGGAQEQTLSGVVSRLQEGLNQTLASIGNAVSRVIDVPSLLTRFRGMVDAIRTVLEAAFAPFKGALAGGDLAQAFKEAQTWTITALEEISKGFFSFLGGLEKVTNGLIDVLNWARSWAGAKYSPDQEKMIANEQNKLAFQGNGLGISGMVASWRNRGVAIESLKGKGLLDSEIGHIDFGLPKLQENLKKTMAAVTAGLGTEKKTKEEQELADNAARLGENFRQAKDAIRDFGTQFQGAFSSPFTDATRQLDNLNSLLAQGRENGVGVDELAKLDLARAAIGKSALDAADAINSKFNEVKLAGALDFNSKEGYSMFARAAAGNGGSPNNVQERIRVAAERSAKLQEKQLDAAKEAATALSKLKVGGGIQLKRATI